MRHSISILGLTIVCISFLCRCGQPPSGNDSGGLADSGQDAARLDGALNDGGMDGGGVLGTPCTNDSECVSGICLGFGRCSQPCSSAADCPASSNWRCASYPGRGPVCDCAPTSMRDLPCNGVDDDCNGQIDDLSRACDGACVDVWSNPNHCGACGVSCGGGSICREGACTCPADRPTVCGTRCVDPMTDVANCGSCGNACPAGANGVAACRAGLCSFTCGSGFADCDGMTANGCESELRTDISNCGGCGHVCSFAHALSTCSTGTCVMTGCAAGFANCDGDASNGCEVETASNASNCGGCAISCGAANATPACTMSTCSIASCTAGFADCDALARTGCEIDVRSDLSNCGACGNACPVRANATRSCASATCSFACTTGYGNCDALDSNGCESALSSDPLHCGSCTNICPTRPNANATCSAGSCGVACASGYANCNTDMADGCEVSTVSDAFNCGACGRRCTLPNATSGCSASTCTILSCVAGFSNCNSNAVDGCEVATAVDAVNCGSCGNACPPRPNAGSVCNAGACDVACVVGWGNCDLIPTNGCEAPVSTDLNNCGSCGNVCVTRPNSAPTCVSGSCRLACWAGFGDCDAVATNGCETPLSGDPTNCGSCGRVCSVPNATAACVGSNCAVGSCSPGFGDCNGLPSDGCETGVSSDVNNCGGCGSVCPAVPNAARTCSAGSCTFTCNAGYGDCDGSAANGCETLRVADPLNCGACGNACPAAPNATPTCVSSTCSLACVSGYANCDSNAANGCESALSSDPNNCSVCGRVCSFPNATAGCFSGSCTIATCNGGYSNCNGSTGDGCEINLQTSASNCGYCGHLCTAPGPNTVPNCSAGACGFTCSSGYADCDGNAATGCEVYLGTNSANCGTCGNVCAGGTVCSGGSCVCPAGQVMCSGVCVSLSTNSSNCGSCGNVCTSGMVCVSSVCQCGTGQALCGGLCVSTQMDPTNCGGCGAVCAPGYACSSGSCARANDLCANATPVTLAAGTTTVIGSTAGATSDSGGCSGGPDVYYSFTLTTREAVYVDSFGSNYNTAVGISTACGSLPTCSDDACSVTQSQVTKVLDPGTYYIVVDGYSTSAGYYTLHIQHLPVVGVAFGTVAAGSYTVSGTTAGMPTQTATCGGGPSPTAWFQWLTCPSTPGGSFSATTCAGRASYDTTLQVANGNGGSACDDDGCGVQSNLSSTIPAGAGLHILYVGGHDAASFGPFTVAGTRP